MRRTTGSTILYIFEIWIDFWKRLRLHAIKETKFLRLIIVPRLNLMILQFQCFKVHRYRNPSNSNGPTKGTNVLEHHDEPNVMIGYVFHQSFVFVDLNMLCFLFLWSPIYRSFFGSLLMIKVVFLYFLLELIYPVFNFLGVFDSPIYYFSLIFSLTDKICQNLTL